MDRAGGDDDEADGDVPVGSPLHPDDRLWRHPSELASAGLPSAIGRPGRRRGGGRWLPVVLAGTVGALLATGLMTATGGFERDGGETATVATSSTLPISSRTAVVPPSVADLAQRLGPSLLAVSGIAADGRLTRGSGVAIRPGHVITSARVVVDSREPQVLVGGISRPATLVGADPDTDLAVLAVDGGGLAPVPWGDAADLRPGDPAVAISSPPASEGGPTVTAGIISGVARTVAHAGLELRGLLQVDRPVPPEGAGGALLDPAGALVGITLPAGVTAAPFGYAVPAEVAKEVARQILTRGRVAHPWLGVEGADRGMNGGAEVQRVKPGSPADQAGLLPGDVVTEVDGVPVSSMGTLLAQLRQRQPGDTVRLLVARANRAVEVVVTLGDRP